MLLSNVLLSYEPSKSDASGDDENDLIERLAECVETVDKVFIPPTEKSKKSKKKEKPEGNSGEDAKPIDLLVDDLIGYLEKSSAFMRVVANRVFEAVCGEVEGSTVHLLLTVSTWSVLCTFGMANDLVQQLEGQGVTAGDELEDAEMNGEEIENDEEEEEEEESSEEEENSSSSDGPEDDEDDEMAEVDPEIRREVADALRTSGVAGDSEDDNGSSSSDSDGDDIPLDDEQMMALDDKLAEIFKSRGVGKSKAGRYLC